MFHRHISVAIKVLHRPLDDMNPTLRTQFDAEVKFMRSIRHPHILIFYGAGVDHENRAFLVRLPLSPLVPYRRRLRFGLSGLLLPLLC